MIKWVVMLLVAGAVVLGGLWWSSNTAVPRTVVKADAGQTSNSPATRITESNLFTKKPSVTGGSAVSLETQRQCRGVFAISNATERKAAFDKLLERARDAAGIKGVLEVLNEMFKTGRRFDEEWNSFWHVMAHRDPKATMALIDSYGMHERWYQGAVNRSLQEWGNLDPRAAMEWLDANRSLTGEALDDATLNLIHGYAARDLKGATGYALQVFNPKDSTFNYVALSLTRNAVQQGGVNGLLAWFNELPDGLAKQQIFHSVGLRLGEVDPTQKHAWLDAEKAKPYRNDQTYREHIGIMAENGNPREAMECALAMPRSPQSKTRVGLGYAAFAWLAKDPAGFASYYNTLPPGEGREGIVGALRSGLNDPNLPVKKRAPAQQFIDGLK